MSADHGQFSGIKGITRAKSNRNIERTIDKALAEIAAEKRVQQRADAEKRRATRAAEAARPKLTHDDIDGARLVRDKWGWHRVIRVNAKTVTVPAPFEVERIPFARILEVKR